MNTDDTPQPWRFEDIEGARDHFTPERRKSATPRGLPLDPADPGGRDDPDERAAGADDGDSRDNE